MISLGDAIQGIQFSPEEWGRIATLAANDGLPGKILRKHAPQTEGFRKIASQMKIAGYSPGRPGHTNKAVDLIISHLNEQAEGPRRKSSRSIYLNSVVHYVQGTLHKLNKLLLEVQVEDKRHTTAELFSLIADRVHEYDVVSSEVSELYECWGFERDPSVELIIRKCNEVSVDAKQNKRLNALENVLQELQKKYTDQRLALEENLQSQAEEAMASAKVVKQLSERISAVESSLLSVEQKIRDLERVASTIQENARSLKSELLENAKAVRGDLEVVQRRIAEIPGSITNQISSLKDEVMRTLRSENEVVQSESYRRINQKFEAIAAQQPRMQGPQEVKGFISPLYTNPPKYRPHSCKITDENQFINLWKRRLFTDGAPLCFESAAIFHGLFSSGRCFVVDDDRFSSSWLKTLGWESSRLDLVASPAWLSEEDWKNGSEFLFKSDEQTVPKSLYIHNFDAGVVQAYLIPTLRLWHLNASRFPLSKLFLIPCSCADSTPQAEVLEYAIDIPDEEVLTDRALPSTTKLREVLIGEREASHTGVKPEDFLDWLGLERSSYEVRNEVAEISRWSGIRLPQSVGMRFSRVQQSLVRFFNEEDAKQIAAYHCICPWIRAKLGDDKSDEFYGLLKNFHSKALNY